MGKEDLSCAEKLAKWFLVALNIIFVILGLVLFILGMVVRFAPNVIVNNYIQPLLNGNPNQAQIQAQVDSIDLTAFFNIIGIAIIVVGAIMMLIGSLGLFGACCQVRCMLISYAVIVIVLLLIQFGLFIAYFTQKEAIDNAVKTTLKDVINNEYRGSNATDVYSLALNFLFVEGECCGVDRYEDMHTATKWRRRYSYRGNQYTLNTPFTCCKLEGTFPNYQRPNDLTCAVNPNQGNSNYQTGCFQVIDEYIANNITASLIAVFVIFALIEVAAVIFAILLTVGLGRSSW